MSGKVTNVPPVPGLPAGLPASPVDQSTEARSVGPANLNETIPAEQRRPEGAPLSAGPKIGKNGEHQPASYKLQSGNIRTDR